MKFSLPTFIHPDFAADNLKDAPDCKFLPAPADFVAPEYYHATTIFPEYFKHGDEWLLAKESRMDSVAVLENGTIHIREFRNIKKGDLVATGRT